MKNACDQQNYAPPRLVASVARVLEAVGLVDGLQLLGGQGFSIDPWKCENRGKNLALRLTEPLAPAALRSVDAGQKSRWIIFTNWNNKFLSREKIDVISDVVLML